jgi:beta-N-acetylhexosaminidase
MLIPKASEFFIIGLDQEEIKEQELSLIKEGVGIILFKRNISSLSQVLALNNSILKKSPLAPIISVDQEGGRVARLRGICTDIPPMLELEPILIKNLNLAYQISHMQGRELKALGFNLNFSPVSDIFSHPENKVIGDRAFSTKAKTVASLAREFIKGLQDAGIAACAKHFPGHGATDIDSHFALPILKSSESELLERELIPFIMAINTDVASIMTAHIINQALDTLPATMSRNILEKLLREKLDYNNVIISDDLEMKAVADNYALREIIEKSFRASVDMFIMGHDLAKNQEAIGILQHLIDTDEEIRKNSIKAASRVNNLRKKFLATESQLSSAQKIVRSKPHLELLESLEL